jgi:hypothetical protein
MVLLLTMAFFSTKAQTGVLNSADLLTPGAIMTVRSAANATVADTTLQGSDVQWDLGALSATGAVLTTEVIDPSSAPQIALFPEANRVFYESAGPRWTYFHVDSERLDRIGMHIGTNTLVYDDPQTEMIFPMTLGTSHVDDWSTTAPNEGTMTFSVIGHGSLTLPQGTYDDVLLIRYTNITTSNIKQYVWLDATNGAALVARTIVNDQSPGTVIFITDLSTDILVQHDRERSDMRIVSPVISELMIQYSSDQDHDYMVSDMAGRVILQGRLARSNEFRSTTLNVEGLNSGFYLFSVTGASGGPMKSQKFFKE